MHCGTVRKDRTRSSICCETLHHVHYTGNRLDHNTIRHSKDTSAAAAVTGTLANTASREAMFRSLLSDPNGIPMHTVPAYFPSAAPGLAMAAFTSTPTAALTPMTHGYSASTRDSAIVVVPVNSLPDKLRCGYTSKRCENPRTVKKSGGLHRFCAYHRERANKNQWRVDNRRRLLRRMAPKSGSDCGSPRSTTSETQDDTDAADSASFYGDDKDTSMKTEYSHGILLDLVDPAGSPDMLSEQDAKILNAMLFSDEDEPPAASSPSTPKKQAPPCAPASSDDHAPQPPTTCEGPTATCMCSQCLAWSTMYFYQEAMETARQTRHQTYSSV